jgi:hypothetical protein
MRLLLHVLRVSRAPTTGLQEGQGQLGADHLVNKRKGVDTKIIGLFQGNCNCRSWSAGRQEAPLGYGTDGQSKGRPESSQVQAEIGRGRRPLECVSTLTPMRQRLIKISVSGRCQAPH